MFLTIAKKNLLNAFYAFFIVDTKAKANLKTMQKLASLASRYTLTCPCMSPFTGALNRMTTGWIKDGRLEHKLKDFSHEAIISVNMLRAHLYLMSRHEGRVARPLASFQPGPLCLGVKTDASLTGAGGLLYERSKTGTETWMGGFAVDLVTLSFKKDSGYQNTAEFIGIILSLLALAQLGIRDVDIEVRGDGKAALSWASTHCFKSPKATNALMVFILTCISFGFTVRESDYIPGTKNWREDVLSRKIIGSTAVEDVMRKIGLEHIPVAHIENNQLQPLKIYE
jgi:hypothetical protein